LLGLVLFGSIQQYSNYANEKRIESTLKKLFEKPGEPLVVLAVRTEGDVALADWLQDGKGGRALLQKYNDEWSLTVCGGASLREATPLLVIGMTRDAADRLLGALQAAESNSSNENLKILAAGYQRLPH
jgi:hypothetical protein